MAKPASGPRTLHEFLQGAELCIDEVLDDGGGQRFPLRAREIDATVLFADMSGFTRRSRDITPMETLILANTFVAWLTGEGLRRVPCIVDKYIGDAMMVVFSNEFGSRDHLLDALVAARWFAEHDSLGLYPHMGLASGRVAVGYIGTEKRLQCSVFGLPVTVAARCASYRIRADNSASIVMPADLWRSEFMKTVFGPVEYVHVITKERSLGFQSWRRLRRRRGRMKHIEDIDVIPIIKHAGITLLSKREADGSLTPTSVERDARQTLDELEKAGKYRRLKGGDT